jgi:hypothetical protein
MLCIRVFSFENEMGHPLETELNASSRDILDAISHGFRTKVDVKGKLAEYFLFKKLQEIEKNGKIKNLIWNDTDGMPDFSFAYNSNPIIVECKNIRNQNFKTPPAYRVEIQKTRNSKDGTNSRSYRIGYFTILAVCLFNQTSKWDYYFIKSSDLATTQKDSNLLEIMQRVPMTVRKPWTTNILGLL